MSVDPVDDCTFWYTNEYYANTGIINWATRISAFQVQQLQGPKLDIRPTTRSIRAASKIEAVAQDHLRQQMFRGFGHTYAPHQN